MVYTRTNSAHMKIQLVTYEVKWFLNSELNCEDSIVSKTKWYVWMELIYCTNIKYYFMFSVYLIINVRICNQKSVNNFLN